MKKTKRTRKPKRKAPKRQSVLQVTTQSASASAPVNMPAGALLLFGGLCLIVICWGILLCFRMAGNLLFTENPRFLLQNVEAKSDGVMTEAFLLQQSEVKMDQNLYALNLVKIQQNLETHPKIREATVRRHLPDRLSMMVSERVPVARLGQTYGGLNFLVSADGLLIQKSGSDKHLPFLKGVGFNMEMGQSIYEGPARAALEYLEILKDFPANKRELLDVAEISVGHPDYLDWRLRNNYQLLMPRKGDFVEMLEKASRLIQANETRNLGVRVFNLQPDANQAFGAPE